MAKRILLVSVFAAIVAGGAFAQVGLGAGYIDSGRSMGAMARESSRYGDATYDYGNTSRGGFLFLDATYAELSLGLVSGILSAPGIVTDKDGKLSYAAIGGFDSILSMDIGLLGRYPIRVAKITVSPLLGVGYNLVLSAKYRTGNDIKWGKGDLPAEAGDFSTIRIMLGAGADFDVTDHVFARMGYTAHYRFAPKAIAKVAERLSNEDAKYGKGKNGGFGGTITFAVGYRF